MAATEARGGGICPLTNLPIPPRRGGGEARGRRKRNWSVCVREREKEREKPAGERRKKRNWSVCV